MPKKIKQLLSWLSITLLVILLDQGSKQYVVSIMNLYDNIVLIPNWFNITLLHNHGAAFSFLSDQQGWQRWFLSILAIITSIILTYWLYDIKKQQVILALALSLILGGALGNVIDRMYYGYVIDFINISLPIIPLPLFNPWPTFNIADSAICIGCIFLLVDAFWGKKI